MCEAKLYRIGMKRAVEAAYRRKGVISTDQHSSGRTLLTPCSVALLSQL